MAVKRAWDLAELTCVSHAKEQVQSQEQARQNAVLVVAQASRQLGKDHS